MKVYSDDTTAVFGHIDQIILDAFRSMQYFSRDGSLLCRQHEKSMARDLTEKEPPGLPARDHAASMPAPDKRPRVMWCMVLLRIKLILPFAKVKPRHAFGCDILLLQIPWHLIDLRDHLIRLCRHPGDHKPMVIVDLKPGVSSNMVEYVRILEERDP